MNRKASAIWQGGLKDGRGTISTESAVLSQTQYSFGTRFENGKGTNPEELIAAAHAGCYSMALSAELGKSGITPVSIETAATVTLDKLDSGWTVTKVHLDVKAKIPGADTAAFNAAAETAKANCPISKLLNATITMQAALEK
ncbi:MAG: OsmC family protein [Acidobacteria bacterium]|nr:OsmC family protein [Acidobacteriota bacterium]